VFEAVVRCGSTVAAAAELGLTHGAVSRRVRVLEEHLGAAMFNRGRGGRLVPTEAGERFAQTARRALGMLADAAQAAGYDDARRRVVRISTTASLAALRLLPRLHRFRARHPAFEVWVSETQSLVEPGAASGVDLALRTGAGGWPGVRTELVMKDTLVPVCAASAATRLWTPADFASVRLLHDEDPAAAWWRWTEAAGLGRPDWGARGPRLAGVAMLLQAAAAGEGVALVPSRLAAGYMSDGRLVTPLVVRAELHSAYWLVRPARGTSTPAVRAFATWIRTEARDSKQPIIGR
jgi:LysR family transcriptional regulator, glycine cleavage system transcriptional activator